MGVEEPSLHDEPLQRQQQQQHIEEEEEGEAICSSEQRGNDFLSMIDDEARYDHLDELVKARATLDQALSRLGHDAAAAKIMGASPAEGTGATAAAPTSTIETPSGIPSYEVPSLKEGFSRAAMALKEKGSKAFVDQLKELIDQDGRRNNMGKNENDAAAAARDRAAAGNEAGGSNRWTSEVQLALPLILGRVEREKVLNKVQTMWQQASSSSSLGNNNNNNNANDDNQSMVKTAPAAIVSIVEEEGGLILHIEDLEGRKTSQLPWISEEDACHQLALALRRIDRILPSSQAEVHAATIIRAIHLCLVTHDDVVGTVLGNALTEEVRVRSIHGGSSEKDKKGGGNVSNNYEDGKQRPLRPRHVRVRLGWKQWGSSFFGLGFFVETFGRVELRDQHDDADKMNQPLAALLCSSTHAFPLMPPSTSAAVSSHRQVGGDEEGENSLLAAAGVGGGGGAGNDDMGFMDAATSEAQASVIQAPSLLNLESSHVSIRLRLVKVEEAGSNMENDQEHVFSSEDEEDGQEGRGAAADKVHRGGKLADAVASSNTMTMERPLVTQLFGWGDNQCGCLGLSTDGLQPDPQILPLSLSLPVIERIETIALSSRHALVLTVLGSVYSCGDGTDGALGHGDLLSSPRFRLIETFAGQHPVPLIKHIAAGSDVLGTQSAAIDAQGQLYTWGFGPATGHGVGKPVQEPRKIEGPLGKERIRQVACGGAFCLAVTTTGRVYSWGLWAHGRLGIGPPVTQVDRFNRRKVQKYKLMPTPVRGKMAQCRVIKVAAGLGHSLALTEKGALWAWGRDDLGQLGIDQRVTGGAFASVFEPECVVALGAADNKAVDVVCGAFHSLAVDEKGGLWTWGAAGGACLGHGDVVLIDSRHTVDLPSLLRKQAANGGQRLPMLTSKPSWALPRKVEAMGSVHIKSASAGSHHSAAITSDGRLFLWGESVSTLRPIVGEEDDDDDETEEEVEEEGEEKEKPKQPKRTTSSVLDVEGVEIPKQPCAVWLPRLAGKWIETISCGGHNTFALCTGERIGMTLGKDLWTNITKAIYSPDHSDDWSVASAERSYLGSAAEDAAAGGPPLGTDLVLLVSGRVLYAHKLILSRRSPTFRELIAAEEYPGESTMVQLLLPDLRYDVARALLQFIYTDNLLFSLDFRTSLPQELLVAAQAYQLPRLEAICRSSLNEREPTYLNREADIDDGHDDEDEIVPSSSMPTDMSTCLSRTATATWADVRFIANGRALLAHRFILAAKSEYFHALFRSGMKETGAVKAAAAEGGKGTSGGGAAGATLVEIVVPDSYECMLRLLLFIYTGQVEEGSTKEVIEDLMAADRYRLLELKALCESMVEVNEDNCLNTLGIAEMYSAPCLREAALTYAVRHLDRVVASPTYQPFAATYPRLICEMFEKIKANSPHLQGVSEEDQATEEDEAAAAKEEKTKEGGEQAAYPFPWRPIATLLICALLYREMSRMVALGPMVPVLNLFFTMAILVYAFIQMR